MVRDALLKGYRLIDTAQLYRNEAYAYKVIKDSVVDRKEIFFVNKVSEKDPNKIEKSVKKNVSNYALK